MTAYRRSTGAAPLILNLGTRWMWVVNITPRPLYSQKQPQDTLKRTLGEPQCWSRHFGDEKNNFSPNGIQTAHHPTRSLVSILTMLHQSLESVTDTGHLTMILQLYTLCRSVMIINYKLGKPKKIVLLFGPRFKWKSWWLRHVCQLLNYKIMWHYKKNSVSRFGMEWSELSEHNSQKYASVHMLRAI